MVSLPGNSRQWPIDVKVDGKPVIVMHRDSSPTIKLQPGSYTVSGRFKWLSLPEYLQLPVQSALVSLSVNGRGVGFPNSDESGRLWFKKLQKEEKLENRLKVESFRLIDDVIPPRIIFHIMLDVAGSAREITLGPIYPPGKFIPVSLKSSLPAKLGQDARMRVQVRPGRYSFTLTIRSVGPLQALSFDHPNDGFWPDQEIWSFSARSNMRIVEIEGVPAIDPLQTSVPQKWQQYPVYVGEALDAPGFFCCIFIVPGTLRKSYEK